MKTGHIVQLLYSPKFYVFDCFKKLINGVHIIVITYFSHVVASLLLSKWSISYILCKFYGGWFLLKYFLIHWVSLCFCDDIFRLTL